MIAGTKRRKEGRMAETNQLDVYVHAAFKSKAWLWHLDVALSFLLKSRSPETLPAASH